MSASRKTRYEKAIRAAEMRSQKRMTNHLRAEQRMKQRKEQEINKAAAWLEQFLNSEEGKTGLQLLKALNEKVEFAQLSWGREGLFLTPKGYALGTYHIAQITPYHFVCILYSYLEQEDKARRITPLKIDDLQGGLKNILLRSLDKLARSVHKKEEEA